MSPLSVIPYSPRFKQIGGLFSLSLFLSLPNSLSLSLFQRSIPLNILRKCQLILSFKNSRCFKILLTPSLESQAFSVPKQASFHFLRGPNRDRLYQRGRRGTREGVGGQRGQQSTQGVQRHKPYLLSVWEGLQSVPGLFYPDVGDCWKGVGKAARQAE